MRVTVEKSKAQDILQFFHNLLLMPPSPIFEAPLKMIYTNNFFCQRGHEIAFDLIIESIRYIVYEVGQHFVSIRPHENDPS